MIGQPEVARALEIEPSRSAKAVVRRILGRNEYAGAAVLQQGVGGAVEDRHADVLLGLCNRFAVRIGEANGEVLAIPSPPRAGVEHI